MVDRIGHDFHASQCYSESAVSFGFGRRNSAVAAAPAFVSVDVDISDSANVVSGRRSLHSRSTNVSERELLHE